jgi:hypothetical protein
MNRVNFKPELAEWIEDMEALRPKVFLIGKRGEKQAACPLCHKLVLLKGYRQRKLGALCPECIDAEVAEALRKYQELIDAGVPKDRRYVETPMHFNWFLTDEWWDKLRDGILRLNSEEESKEGKILVIR